MNEETTETPVVNPTGTQPTETEDEQKSLAKNENAEKGEQLVSTTTDKPTETLPADQNKPTETDSATPVKPDPTQTTEEPKKLADVVPTSLVWISGMVGSRQIDCAGPIELPFKITKPTWPYTPVEPNSNYTNQIFDYENGTWVATDAKSQGQQISDLAQKVQDLQKNSENHDKSADRAEKMGVQTTRILTSLTQQISTISQKLDTVLNTKDGDK